MPGRDASTREALYTRIYRVDISGIRHAGLSGRVDQIARAGVGGAPSRLGAPWKAGSRATGSPQRWPPGFGVHRHGGDTRVRQWHHRSRVDHHQLGEQGQAVAHDDASFGLAVWGSRLCPVCGRRLPSSPHRPACILLMAFWDVRLNTGVSSTLDVSSSVLHDRDGPAPCRCAGPPDGELDPGLASHDREAVSLNGHRHRRGVRRFLTQSQMTGALWASITAAPLAGDATVVFSVMRDAPRRSAPPWPPPPSTYRDTSGSIIAVVLAVMIAAPAGSAACRVTGSNAPGAEETPWTPMSPERTTPSTRDPERNVVTAVLPGCRSTTGSTSRDGPSGMVRLTSRRIRCRRTATHRSTSRQV